MTWETAAITSMAKRDDPRPGGDGGRHGVGSGGVEPIPLSGYGGVQPPRACFNARLPDIHARSPHGSTGYGDDTHTHALHTQHARNNLMRRERMGSTRP
jgi:hypothetical protein